MGPCVGLGGYRGIEGVGHGESCLERAGVRHRGGLLHFGPVMHV